jgi:hypothetical protein
MEQTSVENRTYHKIDFKENLCRRASMKNAVLILATFPTLTFPE